MTPPEEFDPQLARYSRQMLFERIGPAGQRRLKHARVTLVGCGALGSVIASTLVRAGVGLLRIVDRDYIELDNLQRQILFDEHDIAHNLPKAEAAARKLRKINSAVEVEGVVADANPGNLEALCEDVELILDGTDNLETRFLINDVAVKHNLPWVYGACVAAEGLMMAIVPRDTPCLRCVWEDPPPPGVTPTCETVGVLAAVVNMVASLQTIEAMKILTGRLDELNRGLISIDAWRGQMRVVNVQSAYETGHCRCCKQGEYDFLGGKLGFGVTALCGGDAVQVLPLVPRAWSGQPAPGKLPAASGRQAPGHHWPGSELRMLDFKGLAVHLPSGSRPVFNEFMLRFGVGDYQVTLFPDGRAIIKGTSDPATARSIYAKYVGG